MHSCCSGSIGSPTIPEMVEDLETQLVETPSNKVVASADQDVDMG